MSSAYDKLRRILVLEREQGCRDRAVIGGLARFLTYWAKEAREESVETRFSLSVDDVLAALEGYESLSYDQRVRAVEGLVIALFEAVRSAKPAPREDAPPAPQAVAAKGPEPDGGPMPDSKPGPDAPSEANERDDERAPARGLAADAPSRAKAEADDWDEGDVAAAPLAETPAPARVSPPRRRRPAKPAPGPITAPVTLLKGVSTVNQKRLALLGIHSVRDLLYHLPRRYDDFAQLKTINRLQLGDEVTIVGVVKQVRTQRLAGGRPLTLASLTDGTGTIEARWFNQPYLGQRLVVGAEVALSGRVSEYLGRLLFASPEWEPLERDLLHTAGLVPVYPLTGGVPLRWLRRLIKGALDDWMPSMEDPLPADVRRSAGLIDLPAALEQVHFPSSPAMLARARERLCFDELFVLQLGIMRHRQAWRAQRGRAFELPHADVAAFIAGLPYPLTTAQQRAIDTILADLAQPVPMNRLLQGDVGSGKTVVAAAAMLATARNGLQAAMMAPTSILAEQHYRTLSRLLSAGGDLRCELLTGSVPAAERERIRADLSRGLVQVVVGTHALIQEAVDFGRLGLIVVDEQHRFGVAQRTALQAKGNGVQPHMLAMSATPIPRSLALTVYGDLDVSVLDEMPANRQPVITAVRNQESRERIYSFIRSQVEAGHQAFVICPLVEESDHSDARAAVSEFKRLRDEVFVGLRLGLVHGRLSGEDKDRVMGAFGAGELDILVSTSVVEVGVDIPNATVILVEGADRFGLAQLHQFRGRVGRGEARSYCILLADDPSPEGAARLAALEETSDGFVLAEKDLELRGPGQFFGLRQSGLPELRVARLSDTTVLEKARREAQRLFETDPTLERPEHRPLAAEVAGLWCETDSA